jgi:hypothetical protein
MSEQNFDYWRILASVCSRQHSEYPIFHHPFLETARMTKRNRTRLFVEQLENRLVPTFNFVTDASGNRTISGQPDFNATNPTPGSTDS